jgi:hypothetical protein
MDDLTLRSFATVRQLEYLDAVEQLGSQRAAAAALGVAESTLRTSLKSLRKKVQMRSTEEDTLVGATSTSTLCDGDGNVKLQWVKRDLKKENLQEAIRAFVEDLAKDIAGKSPDAPAPEITMDELLAVYPFGDPHFGLKTWGEETGDGDWDLEIAAGTHEAAVRHLAQITPPAAHALLLNLGDAIHMNGSSNTTFAGTRVDADTRYGKVLQETAMSFVRCILTLLEKHQHVTVWCMTGNHDTDSSLALQIALKFYFSNNPRVTVDDGTSLYKYMRFGKVLIGSHHGHGAKAADLPLIMAADRAKDWGETEHRVWHCGHIHHKQVLKDYTGCTVETHRTLARQDAWHAGQGYRSKKDMSVIVYHREFGELQRSRFDVAMAA